MASAEQTTDKSIWLWDEAEYSSHDGFRPWLDPYPVENSGAPRGAVIVFPGGGYAGRSPHEGGAVAERFNELGFPTFVVNYSIAPRKHPQMLLDASRAVRIIRSRAQEWNINPHKLAVCGFSAGGHLAASLGVHYDKPYLKGNGETDNISNRPDALILCYPVITSGEYAHRGSFENLLGMNPSDEMLEEMSLEKQVTSNTPPSFLWHTAEDKGVPVENSLLFASALSANGILFEMHIYPQGAHGLGLGVYPGQENVEPWLKHVSTWADSCVEWLDTMGFK